MRDLVALEIVDRLGLAHDLKSSLTQRSSVRILWICPQAVFVQVDLVIAHSKLGLVPSTSICVVLWYQLDLILASYLAPQMHAVQVVARYAQQFQVSVETAALLAL